MNRKSLFLRLNPFLTAGLILGLISGVFFLGAEIVPAWRQAHRPPAQIDLLRKQERSIQAQFSSLMAGLQRRSHLAAASFPQRIDEIHRWLLSLSLDPETEGVVYLKDGEMILWHGQVIPPSLIPPSDGATHVVRHKASVFLATTLSPRSGESLVFLRLLVFSPQLRTPLLRPYHFLDEAERENALLDFYEDSDDVSGFEKIFSRHHDEYVSQPRSRSDILTIFFPLRNESRRLLATVNLRSPTPAALLERQKQAWRRAAWLALVLAFFGIAVGGYKSWRKASFRSPALVLLCLLAVIGARYSSLRLTQLASLPSALLSPATASLSFPGGLMASPLDIFLTTLAFLLILSLVFIDRRHLFIFPRNSCPSLLSLIPGLLSCLASFIPFLAFQFLALIFVNQSSAHLLRFSPALPSLLILFSLIFLLIAAILLSLPLLRVAQSLFPTPLRPWLSLLPLIPFFFSLQLSRLDLSLSSSLLLTLSLLGFYLAASFPILAKRAGLRLLVIILTAAFLHLTLHVNTASKEKSLTEEFLRESILSQDDWAEYLLQSSLPVLEKEQETILRFLREGEEGPLARLLWEKTSLARWNWYSSLEIIDQQGRLLSRFSLNVPLLFRPAPTLPLSQEWNLGRTRIPFPGREKTFLLGYRDFWEGGLPAGRIVLYVLLDEEMFPFLYSAVPYYDLLRMPSIPSLKEFRFGLAVFGADGQIIFNPHQLTTGISPEDLRVLADHPEKSLWSSFTDRHRRFQVYYFWNQDKIVAIFWPAPRLVSLAVEFLKIFFPLLALIYLSLFLSAIISGRRRLTTFFWAFSSRVYASFIAVILILLVLFSFFVQSFFNRMATQRFSEKAEIQARVARNIIEDLLFFQGEEGSSPLPVEDLVLWVSTAIANDVNVYQEGRLIASSRQEFFDSGILPDYLDGEVSYRLRYEKHPYVVWWKRIGGYSFQTLTVPLNLNGSLFLISLPFPFERQEIARSQEELVEFLVLISALSLLVVLLFARSIGAVVITPIKKLLLATREVGSGNLDVFIEHRGRDEMQTLIEGFNRMVRSLKQHEQELAEMSKKAAWAEMARKVAHEVKNPLTPIRLSAEHILRVYEERPEEFPTALRESVSYIISEVENLRKIAQDFLAISRETQPKRALLNLTELVEEIIFPYVRVLSGRITFHKLLPEQIMIRGDAEKIRMALRNIITNAVEAIRGQGIITIEGKEEEDGVVIEVIDTGIGMDRMTLARVFEPDFSTKDLGTGLGLPIAKRIIEDHGGSIYLTSTPGKGTRVRVFLPHLSGP